MRGWIWFIFVQLVELVAFIVGLFVLLPLAATGAWYTRNSRYFPGRAVTVWRGGKLTWIWGNEEDGVTGAPFYVVQHPNIHMRAYFWSALRNPANNLRFVFQWKGGPFYRWENKAKSFYAQAGWYSNGYPVLSLGSM